MKHLPLILLVFLLFTFSAFAQTEVDTFIEKAREYAKEQKFEDSVAEITKAIAIEPNNANLYIERGQYYFLLDKKAELLNDVQKAVSINPTDKKILYFGASLLNRSQQPEEALKIANALIALGNVDRFGWYLRISVKTHLNDFVGAFEDATTAIELFPQDANLKQNQANLIRLMGDSDKALEMYNALIIKYEASFAKSKDKNEKNSIGNSLSMFLFSRSRIHFAKFDKEQAQVDLLKAIEYAPQQSNYFLRSRIYKSQKMYAESLADLTMAIELDEKKGDQVIIYLIDRGDVYFLMGKYVEAIKDYEEVIKLDEKQLKEPMEKRIVLAKQKMQGNGNR